MVKKAKSVFCLLLCIALLLSSAPILNIRLFGTDASAATYAKSHTKEYYYNKSDTQFITYLATGGDRNGDTAKAQVTGSGYTLIDKNLNAGVRVSTSLISSRDADEVYLGYKTSSDPTISVRDIRVMINRDENSDVVTGANGFTYTIVGVYPSSEKTGDGNGIVDLNQSKSSAVYLHYYTSKDAKVGAPIVSVTIDNEETTGYETVKYLNSGDFYNNADANKDAKGEYIFTHVARLPEVDTTELRSAMEKADTYLNNSSLYVDVATLQTAKNAAKAITDSYDNYSESSYEAFNTEYDQAAIDNAKSEIENAIAALQTKLDWTAFDTAVSNANSLNENDYTDFSGVENALSYAELVKSGLTTQEQVDEQAAKINVAVNALVKKSTSQSLIQATASGEGVFQASVQLCINNVNVGTNCDYWNISPEQVNEYGDGGITVYRKTAQNIESRWNASTAKIYVDPDINSDILSTGVNISLKMPYVYSNEGKARWGVELAPYENSYNLGLLQESMRSATVTSANGKSLTYTLCDANGNDMASAETNKDFTQDAYINNQAYGPYYWYIKGAVPAAGDKVTVRVLGICAAWAYSDNLQTLTQFTDLTIVSVSKTALKKAIYTVVGNESVYTAESYSAYLTALNEAKTVLNNATAEQTEVDAATTKLNNAINALVAKLDMTKLYASRDKANSLNGSDYEDFSEVANLVNMIPNTAFGTQQEVDDYADKLNYAVSKLIKKSTATSSSITSEQKTLINDTARIYTFFKADNAAKVTGNAITSNNIEGVTDINNSLSFEKSSNNDHGSVDYHRTYQKVSDSTANAYYVFDKYNGTSNISSLGEFLSVEMLADGQKRNQSVALYDTSFTETSIEEYSYNVSASVNGSKSKKSYTYSLNNGGLYADWTADCSDKTWYNHQLSISGAVPDAGDTVQLRVVARNAVIGYKNDAYHYYNWLTLNFVSVDSTALRNAIALSKNVLDKNKYSSTSYANYLTALGNATETLNSSDIPSQDNYDSVTTALVNAINNLERIQTVTLDGQSATTAGTTSVVVTIGKAMPGITLPTREHYNFGGYFTKPNGEGTRYYNADGSSAKSYDLESDVTLYANWEIETFDVNFLNDDGSVIRNGRFAYNTIPSCEDPEKASDDTYEYTFSGWTPEIAAVTADATYTAQFTSTAHEYECKQIDESTHRFVCKNCDYSKEAEKHKLDRVTDSDGKYIYKCSDCGYNYPEGVKSYAVDLPEGCEVIEKKIREDLSLNYYVVTIQAPQKSGDKYFVYWVDGNTGEKVSTYRTYSFFQTGDRSFKPVYADLTEYTKERNSAVFSSTVTEFKKQTGGSRWLYVEHSVAKTIDGFPKYDASNKVESIKNIVTAYGVIYTTDSAYSASTVEAMETVLVKDSGENILNKVAGQSESTRNLTGAIEVKVDADSDVIWARSYVVDANGTVYYGVPKKLTATEDKEATVSTDSIDLDSTALNIEEEAPKPEAETTETTEKSFFDKLLSFFISILIWIIKSGICVL